MTVADLPDNAVLVCIDTQVGFDDLAWGDCNNPEMEARAADLFAAWRAADRPVVHVRHDPAEPDSPLRSGGEGFTWKPEAEPVDGEPVFTKRVNSGFIGTDLEVWLRECNHLTFVVCGLTIDYCVSTTMRMAENLGFDVHLPVDVITTFNQEGHDGGHFLADEMYRTALAHPNRESATAAESVDLSVAR